MAFDKSLDKELFSKNVEFEMTKLTVSVFSYNNGTPKLQISREVMDQNTGKFKWAKLGRMMKDEVEGIFPLIEEAKSHL